MKFTYSTRGDPMQIMLGEILAAERAVTRGTRAAGRGLLRDWRKQVRTALGYRMAGALRQRSYPEQTESINAASLVYAPSKGANRIAEAYRGYRNATASEIINAHDKGAVIRSADGFFLAIPMGPAARMRGADSSGRGDRTRITPGGYERRTGRLLRFVYRKGENSLLVDDGAVTPGSTMKWKKKRKGGSRYQEVKPIRRRKPIPVFVLVPQVRLRSKMDLDRDVTSWEQRLPGEIVKNWKDVHGA